MEGTTPANFGGNRQALSTLGDDDVPTTSFFTDAEKAALRDELNATFGWTQDDLTGSGEPCADCVVRLAEYHQIEADDIVVHCDDCGKPLLNATLNLVDWEETTTKEDHGFNYCEDCAPDHEDDDRSGLDGDLNDDLADDDDPEDDLADDLDDE
jgi:hypothetical protein